jgi:hypothetical protein
MPGYQQLTGQQFMQFSEVLQAAYDYPSLQMMLRFRLDRSLNELAGEASRPFDQVVFDVINRADKQGWVYRLLAAARESNPGHPGLLAFAQQFGLVPTGTPPRPQLEKMIKQTSSYLDIARWREALGLIEGRVCRVEVPGNVFGTGFLLGSDAVMTNYHVVRRVIDKKAAPDKVVLRFDYKRMGDGTVVNPGKVYSLVKGDTDWLIDYSEYSPVDLQPEPKSGAPEPDKLDYALLRADGAPGDEVLLQAQGQTVKRGWLAISDEAYDFLPDTPLFIVQHPEAEPLKLALDTQAVIGLEGEGRRVHYRTNTEGGSSGSPVFDQNWNLVALHHSGDPRSDMPPRYNEGIPISLILAQLKARQVDGALGKQEL